MTERIGHEPLGVVANISAWNYPYFVGGNVFVPALLTGNAVLYKPSEFATLTGLHIDRLLHAAGVPADVFITVVGAGDVGAALLEQRVDGVFFTGSVRDRREDRRRRWARAWCGSSSSSAARIRPTSPTTPTRRRPPNRSPTAPCTTPARAAARSSASTCTSASTTPSSTHFVATVKGFKVGDPLADGTYIGPLTRAPQLEVLEAQVADAVAKGATARGRRQARRARRQLVRADRAHRRRPHDGGDARRELRADHRHPEGERATTKRSR